MSKLYNGYCKVLRNYRHYLKKLLDLDNDDDRDSYYRSLRMFDVVWSSLNKLNKQRLNEILLEWDVDDYLAMP